MPQNDMPLGTVLVADDDEECASLWNIPCAFKATAS